MHWTPDLSLRKINDLFGMFGLNTSEVSSIALLRV